jgi:esterase/lipase/1-acyl-sn-glycerol-3-phosphate acyltransferase
LRHRIRNKTTLTMQSPELDLPPINSRNHNLTLFLLRRLESSLDVRIQLHGLTDQLDMGGGIIVANHFTRLETFVVPFVIHRATKIILRILASHVLFGNKTFGDYLMSIGALPTNHPNKYELIARDILHGGWWLIFPEGGLIKDRRVIEKGRLNVTTDAGQVRRRPRSGAAILAMTVQRYKAALRQALRNHEEMQTICASLGLGDQRPSQLEALAFRPTPIVPLNITYYPLNPQENALKSLATHLLPTLPQTSFGQELLEELTVEGSMLLKGVEIDMRFGDPLLVGDDDIQLVDDWRIVPWSPSPWRRYLTALRSWRPMRPYTYVVDRWAVSSNWRQRQRAWQITRTAMQALYQLATIHIDHLLSAMVLQTLRTTKERRFEMRELQQRLYLAVQRLQQSGHLALHANLTDPDLQYLLVTNTPHPFVEDFARRASELGLLSCQDQTWEPNTDLLLEPWSFSSVRLKNFIQVYYNEVEPLTEVMQAVRYAMRADLEAHGVTFSNAMHDYEDQLYEADHAAFVTPATVAKLTPLPPESGRPALLRGHGSNSAVGVLLIHGFSASPGEVMPLAKILNGQGFTVYIVRLRGHGTSPYDLQQRTWQDWYDSVRRGYAYLRTISDAQFVGGVSTGGALALYLAVHEPAIQGVFAVAAPIKLTNRAIHLAPIVKTVRGFVSSNPDNPNTNYLAFPVQALHELLQFISVYPKTLKEVTVPTLLIQARGDNTVRPDSAQYIYDRLGTKEKELIWKDVDRHVIVSDAFPDVHDDILRFLRRHQPSL